VQSIVEKKKSMTVLTNILYF